MEEGLQTTNARHCELNRPYGTRQWLRIKGALGVIGVCWFGEV